MLEERKPGLTGIPCQLLRVSMGIFLHLPGAKKRTGIALTPHMQTNIYDFVRRPKRPARYTNLCNKNVYARQIFTAGASLRVRDSNHNKNKKPPGLMADNKDHYVKTTVTKDQRRVLPYKSSSNTQDDRAPEETLESSHSFT